MCQVCRCDAVFSVVSSIQRPSPTQGVVYWIGVTEIGHRDRVGMLVKNTLDLHVRIQQDCFCSMPETVILFN